MKDFRSRKKRRHFLYSPMGFFVVFCLLLFLVRAAYISHDKQQQAQKDQESYNQRYEKLLDKRDELYSKIEKLKTEQGIIEEHKKRFNVVEPGESIIHIVESRD